MDEKSHLLTSATEKVKLCVACDSDAPEGRILLVWELPMCGRCGVVVRRTLSSDPQLNPRLARLIGRVLAKKGVTLGDAAEAARSAARPTGAAVERPAPMNGPSKP